MLASETKSLVMCLVQRKRKNRGNGNR